jgi:hypothetical protein
VFANERASPWLGNHPTGAGKTWDEINTHSPAQIMKRVRQIERRRAKIMKLIDLLIEKTGRHQLERTVRHLANLDRYSARAHSKLKREVK